MEFHSVLAQQHPSGRRGRRSPFWLPLLLVLSLMGNAYQLWERHGGALLEAEALAGEPAAGHAPDGRDPSAGAQKREPAALPVRAPAAEPTDAFEKYQAQQAAYYAPENLPGREWHTLHFKIRHSLNRTLCDLLPRPDCARLSAYMGRLLMWHLDVERQLRAGDTVSLVYERLGPEEGFRILHMAYESGYLGKRLVANYYQPPGARQGGYYDEAGREVALRLRPETAPIRVYQEITSLPGDFRSGVWSGHSGTDFKAEPGTPVYAPFEGRVTRINWNRRANGLCLELDHPAQGVRTLYLHLQRVLVKPGQYVQPGEVIAESGNTGRSFAPHLHYEMRMRRHPEKILNPFQFKGHATYRRTLEDRERYRRSVARYASVLQGSLS